MSMTRRGFLGAVGAMGALMAIPKPVEQFVHALGIRPERPGPGAGWVKLVTPTHITRADGLNIHITDQWITEMAANFDRPLQVDSEFSSLGVHGPIAEYSDTPAFEPFDENFMTWPRSVTPAQARQAGEPWPTLTARPSNVRIDRPRRHREDRRSRDVSTVIGQISGVQIHEGDLWAKFDVQEHRLEELRGYQAIVPAIMTNWHDDWGTDRGHRLVLASVTNFPAMPGTELRP